MNIVFWIVVFVVAFLLWYYLSNHFFKIGNDFNGMIEKLKEKFNETEEDNEDEA